MTGPRSFLILLLAFFASGARAQDDVSVWPNKASFANSDPWIAEHHDSIRQMRPRVLVINFSNEHSMAHVEKLVGSIIKAVAAPRGDKNSCTHLSRDSRSKSQTLNAIHPREIRDASRRKSERFAFGQRLSAHERTRLLLNLRHIFVGDCTHVARQ
jgi:hypothetical protein